MNGERSLNQGCMSCGINFRKGAVDDLAQWPVDLVFTLSVVDISGFVVESAVIDTRTESDDTVAVAFAKPEENNELSRGWGNFFTWSEHNLSDVLVNDTMNLQLHFTRQRF
jgi:hypothetical protein